MRNWMATLVVGAFLCAPAMVGAAALEGYDYAKIDNPNHKTPKYLFGRVAMKHELDGVHSKADAQALLESMLPEMKEAGLEIGDIKGDKILVKTEIGWEWVDVVRGAGAPNPGWWWGSEGKPAADANPGGNGGGSAAGGSGAGAGSPGYRPAGGELSTVPAKPEFADADIDTSSDERAVKSAAEWGKRTYPQFFVEGDDRDKCYQLMTAVIGALRAKGYDAHRVVNHPSRAKGDPWRYGSDAVVINGKIYDCYGGMGDLNASRPQALYVGPYAAGRLRE